MKNFLLSSNGETTGIAMRLEDEGHPTRMFVTGDRSKYAGHNIITTEATWRPVIPWADLVIVNGILPPAAKAMLADNIGLAFGLDGQHFVDRGIPSGAATLSFVAFWTGRGWMMPVFPFVSAREQLSGDLGAVVGEMGVAIWPHRDPVPEPVHRVMQKFGNENLKNTDYRGMVVFYMFDLGNGLETGYVRAETDMALLSPILELSTSTCLDFFADIAGSRGVNIETREDVALSAHLSVPPWPWVASDGVWMDKSFTVEPGAESHLWLCDVGRSGVDVSYETGFTGKLGYATSRAKFGTRISRRFREVSRRLDRVISGVYCDSLQYRNDLTEILYQKFTSVEEQWQTT